tara:strand:+ start:94 stop:342 length:249 start_codon:yes stop_codon:yes gene_type:complete
MPFYVYIIGSNEPRKRTYVGWTTDINKRLKAHNASKGAKFTRGSQWKLLHKEKLETKSDAMKREIELKKNKVFRSHLRQNIL